MLSEKEREKETEERKEYQRDTREARLGAAALDSRCAATKHQ